MFVLCWKYDNFFYKLDQTHKRLKKVKQRKEVGSKENFSKGFKYSKFSMFFI